MKPDPERLEVTTEELEALLESVRNRWAKSAIRNRSRFVEVTSNFPEECRFVLESLGEVYGNDARAQEQGLSPEERLRFH